VSPLPVDVFVEFDFVSPQSVLRSDFLTFLKDCVFAVSCVPVLEWPCESVCVLVYFVVHSQVLSFLQDANAIPVMAIANRVLFFM